MRKFFVKGIAVALVAGMCLTGCGDKKDSKNKDNTDNKLETSSIEEQTSKVEDDTTEEDTEKITEEDTEEEIEDDAIIYEKKADAVISNIETFLTAIKNGDIDTLLPYIAEGTDMKKIFEKVKDREGVSDLMQTLFVNMDWTYADDAREELADNLMSGDDECIVNMYICSPMQLYYEHYYCAELEPGTVLPEDYAPSTESEAKEIVKKIVSLTPTVGEEDFAISEIKEDGSFVTDIDLLFHMNHSNIEDAAYAGTGSVYRTFIKEMFDVMEDTIYSPEEASYEKDDEVKSELREIIAKKDFNKLTSKYEELNDEAAPGDVKYGDLTKEQKATVDKIIDEEVVVSFNNAVRMKKGIRSGAIMVTFPAKYYLNKTSKYAGWADEHNVMAVDLLFDSLSSIKTTSMFFLYNYSRIMDHIK